MFTPSAAREKVAKLAPEERSKIVGRLVAEKVEKLLDDAVIRAIASKKSKVDLSLSAKECADTDENLRDFLAGSGYADISVTSDFPGYNESYEGRTFVKFSIP